MSSPTATLCWGISLPYEWHPSWKLDAEEVGIDDPVSDECLAYLLDGKENPPPGNLYGTTEEKREYQSRWHKVRDRYGLTFVRFGSWGAPHYVLAIESSVVITGTSSTKIIRPEWVQADIAWLALLEEAQEKLGLTREKGDWLLAGCWD